MKDFCKYTLFAVLTSIALFVRLTLVSTMKDMDYTVFYNLNVAMMSFLAIGLFYLYKKVGKYKLSKTKNFLTIFFAFFMIIGECYESVGTYQLIFKNILTVFLTIIKLFGYTILFRTMFYYIDILIKKWSNSNIKTKNKKINWYLNKFEEHPFLTCFFTLLIGWSIYLIAFYPIVLSPDPSFQIKQYFNVPTKYINWVIQVDPNVYMTAHHPILQTYLIGWCIEFGRMILNDNFGLFIYTFFQTIFYIAVLSYTIVFAHNNKIQNKWCLTLLLMYLFVPMYPFYSICAVKDTPYTMFMILYVLFLFDIVKNYQNKKISIKYTLYIFAVMVLMALFRHNGLHIVLLSFPLIIIYSKKNILKLSLALGAFFISIYGFNNEFVPSLGISGSSVREMLSIPFQQTARYVKYHGDELTEEDKIILDYVLKFDTISKRYLPEKSDPVKNEFNKYTTKTDLVLYFRIWFKGLTKHPNTYVDATLHNIYGYFYPNSHKWYIYSTYDTRVTEDNLVDYHYNKLEFVRNILTGYGNIFPYIPVVGLLSSIGANTWWLLILCAYLITGKKSRYLIVLMPLIASVLICVISPVNTYFRYTMPYVFLLPILTILMMKDLRSERNEKK